MNPSLSDGVQVNGAVFSNIAVKSSSDSTTFTASGEVLSGRRTNLNNLRDGLSSFDMSWNAVIKKIIQKLFLVKMREIGQVNRD